MTKIEPHGGGKQKVNGCDLSSISRIDVIVQKYKYGVCICSLICKEMVVPCPVKFLVNGEDF